MTCAATPQELDNRIADPEYVSILVEMKERLLEWYLETSDVVPFEADKR